MSIGFIKKMRPLCRLSVYFLCTGQRIKKEDCSVLLDHMYLQVVKIDCLDKVV